MAMTRTKAKAVSHAPGPWAFKEGRAERHEMSSIFKADDPEYLIGYVLCEPTNPHQRPEDIANARLMAAAPDLLAALRHILLLQEEHDGESFETVALHAEEIAREAIAKAELT